MDLKQINTRVASVIAEIEVNDSRERFESLEAGGLIRYDVRSAKDSGSESLTSHSRWTKFNQLSSLEARMRTVNIHEAKTHLSRLIEQAAAGESFVIAKAGKPMVKVSALSTPEAGQVRRLGFLAGQLSVPDDFDRIGAEEIAQLFGANP